MRDLAKFLQAMRGKNSHFIAHWQALGMFVLLVMFLFIYNVYDAELSFYSSYILSISSL